MGCVLLRIFRRRGFLILSALQRSGKADAAMPRSSLRGFGASRATRTTNQSGAASEMTRDAQLSPSGAGDGVLEESSGMATPPVQEKASKQKSAVSTLTVEGELARYRTRDLRSSYKKRLADHGRE